MRKATTALLALALGLTMVAGASAMDTAKDEDAPRKPAIQGLVDEADVAAREARARECNDTQEGLRTFRVSGQNRYETATQISVCLGWTFENTIIVYLASGENFPDALALGPSTLTESGPVLLAARDTLPAATRNELAALQPCLIIAAGGPAAISQSVLQEADDYTVNCD